MDLRSLDGIDVLSYKPRKAAARKGRRFVIGGGQMPTGNESNKKRLLLKVRNESM